MIVAIILLFLLWYPPAPHAQTAKGSPDHEADYFFHGDFAAICITINASVFTGIIRTYIHTCNTSALFSLIRVFFSFNRNIPDLLQTILVDTAAVFHPQRSKISFFRAGIYGKSICFRRLGKLPCNLCLLLKIRSADIALLYFFGNAPVQIQKTYGACFGEFAQPGRKLLEKTYVQIIRELREDNDRTQQELADYLGTSQTMYARYERGANELPIRHLIALCKYYRVSADYILGLSKNKHS